MEKKVVRINLRDVVVLFPKNQRSISMIAVDMILSYIHLTFIDLTPQYIAIHLAVAALFGGFVYESVFANNKWPNEYPAKDFVPAAIVGFLWPLSVAPTIVAFLCFGFGKMIVNKMDAKKVEVKDE